jgi:hypothetical protein
MTKLLEFLKDGENNYSATRLAFLAWSLGVLAVWATNSATSGKSFTLDSQVVYILGILMGGKVTQSISEANAAKNDNKETIQKTTETVTTKSHGGLTGEFTSADGKVFVVKDGIIQAGS